MFLNIIRGIFLVCMVGIALSYITGEVSEDIRPGNELFAFYKPSVLLAIVGLGVAVVGLDILISRKSLSSISGLFLGLLVGMLITFVLALVIDLLIGVSSSDLREPIYTTVYQEYKGKMIPQTQVTGYRDTPTLSAVKLLIGVISCYLSVSFILQTKDDIRFVIPYVEFERQIKGGRPLVLDTSAIIDGRILDVARTKIFDTRWSYRGSFFRNSRRSPIRPTG